MTAYASATPVSTETRSPSDLALIRACRRGDAVAWERLIRRYRRLIYSIPVAYRIPEDGADEIFQTVAVRLFEHIGRIRNPGGLAAWLMVTTRRACQLHLRNRSRSESLEDNAADSAGRSTLEVADRLHRTACEHTLELALARLGDPCLALLRALFMEDPAPSYEEISARLGRPVGSLGPTRARCLAKLRRIYDRLGGTAP